MRVRIMVCLAATIVLATTALAQEPPSWEPLGNLPSCWRVRDIAEIPGSGILIACGYAGGGWYYVWRSTDGGRSWTRTTLPGTYPDEGMRLARDSASGCLWILQSTPSPSSLYRSTDDGQSWSAVSGPAGNLTQNNTMEVVDNYVYLGGTFSTPYSALLYRLNQTSLQWEMVTDYIECNAITRLKYNNGKLLVFAKDMTLPQTRIFSHTPSDLDRLAKPIGVATVTEPPTGR